MVQDGTLPKEIQELLGSHPDANKRTWKTALINKLFEKQEDGKYALATNGASFQHWYKSQDVRFSEASSKGVPGQ